MKTWKGIFAALWTPSDAAEQITLSTLKANLAFLQRERVHGILALGSTGEFLLMEPSQRKRLLEQVIAHADGLPVLANISDIRPGVVTELARFARYAGAAGVALMPPCFYPMAQEDLVEWFVRAAEATELPFFLYNFPERTGNRIAPETVAAVAERIPLAGIKQSGAEFSYHRRLVELGREKHFSVFTGADTRIAEAMSLGVAGCIGGLANGVPDLMVQVYEGVTENKPEQTALASERLVAVGKLVDQLEFPLNVAALMQARGLEPGHPKSVVSPATQLRYNRLVAELRTRFDEWGLSLPPQASSETGLGLSERPGAAPASLRARP